MMTRRIARTLTQLATAAIFLSAIVFLLDHNYRVLPNSLHEYMPTHHAGLVVTDITVLECSRINIFSSCKLDASRWERIDKELHLGQSWTSAAYVFVSRKHEHDLSPDDKVVLDLTVGRLDPSSRSAAVDDRWESRPAGLWIRRSAKKRSSDSVLAVTGVDVLFGDDAVEARDGWAITGTPLLLSSDRRDMISAHITMRRGDADHDAGPRKPVPRIPPSGRFKIMQIGDLHLSTGVGVCRDAVPEGFDGGPCEADPRTLEFVGKMLDEEKPDLVVLSGDQINGGTAPDAPTAIFKIAALLIKRQIPYASIFGNHDDEETMSRAAQMKIYESLPYSLATSGPAGVDGVGNYYVEVLARGKSDHSALTLYLVDTHAYSPDERHFPGYAWVKPSQIDWFRRTADSLKARHSEYTHRHMDIAFIHIPLTEYTDWDLPRVGSWLEGVTAPTYNSGFHDALVDKGVVMVSAGHDHCNDYCSLSFRPRSGSGAAGDVADHRKKTRQEVQIPPDGHQQAQPAQDTTPAMWMCYAGGVGFGGYAGYFDYVRRLRLFEVDTNEARITTWKRLEAGNTAARIDEQIIVDGGKPVAPMPPH
ncbi:DNA repair exonuclease SbcCD nuclease subunit [Geosmithia morbida]|uniref:DNA repair exonuclease SbcCD nuclease subunit n=1 Tax=Geosmithia morbida TaxID=1094350 RepID=A0A9P4YSQ2_9HYPO|nr:DNA repair exonuclease SbcCD nuclease subunit [Geosmithia morbida]KAF4121827.1 DNA repair exonuclease SbcCD nuclease subunit [Geosmithia morbida]